MKIKINQINKMLKTDFDWKKYWENSDADGIEWEIRKVYKHIKRAKISGKYHQCKRYEFEDEEQPKALYRCLYFLAPGKVDFSDMYKCNLMYVESPCKEFLISVELYKYELRLYCYCRSKYYKIVKMTLENIDGAECDSELGNLWFDTFFRVLKFRLCIYPGNDFCV